MPMRIRRSAAVTIAVTFQQLIDSRSPSWTAEQALVIDALRRSNSALSTATEAQLGDYLAGLDPEQLRGVASNVKGIFHEMLVMNAENLDGDEESARMFDQLNQPGADIEFIVDDEVVREVQVKAVQDPAAIVKHFARYPDIDVVANSEAYEALVSQFPEQIVDSTYSNSRLSSETQWVLDELEAEGLSDVLQDGLVTSVLVGGALQARALLQGRPLDDASFNEQLKHAGVAAGTALTLDALLNLV